jgi:hypothetical protein
VLNIDDYNKSAAVVELMIAKKRIETLENEIKYLNEKLNSTQVHKITNRGKNFELKNLNCFNKGVMIESIIKKSPK